MEPYCCGMHEMQWRSGRPGVPKSRSPSPVPSGEMAAPPSFPVSLPEPAYGGQNIDFP